MPDQRSAMKEYRLLDQKRLAEGLTPEEEARLGRLRDLVGGEASGGSGGFDVNAAAARLRESLLPAGLRNRPPPDPALAEPEPAAEPAPGEDAEAVAAAWADAPFAPMEGEQPAADPYFDPASLGGEGAEQGAQALDPNAQPYDPDAAADYDPGAAQAWDQNGQPYDPGTEAAAAYDPNAPQAWDPNAGPYDPGTEPAAAYDPNAEQPWDQNAEPYDPGTEPAAAYDPNAPQAWDPNAAAAYDPNAAQAYDPNAQPYDPNAAAAYDPNAAQAFDPNAAAAYDPNAGQAWDPNAQPYDPNAAAAYDPNAAQAWDPNAQPYDPNAAAAYDPNAAQAWDPNAQPGPEAEQPFELASQPLDLGADPSAEPAAGGWDPNAGWETGPAPGEGPPPADALAGALDLAALDPSAEPAPDLAADALPPLSLGAYDDPDATPLSPEAAEPDFGVESALPFDPSAVAAVEPGDVDAGEGATPAGAPLGAYDDLAGFEHVPAHPEDLPADAPGFRAASAVGDEAAAWQPEGALEEGFQLESGGSFESGGGEGTEPLYAPAPAAEELAAPLDAAEVTELGEADLAEIPDPGSAPEEIPTIDGEEILEELPPEAAPPPASLDFEAFAAPPAPPPEDRAVPAPSAPPAPEPGSQVEGSHRVVIHTLEGQVKRGVLESPDLAAAVLGLAAQPGAEPEVIGTDKVKAIFFMLAPGEKAPSPEGHKVRVTFRDGRQVAGFSPDYREGAVGFFMVPADTRTNTGKIWVYRSAVRQVSVT